MVGDDAGMDGGGSRGGDIQRIACDAPIRSGGGTSLPTGTYGQMLTISITREKEN